MKGKRVARRASFVSPNEKAKSEVIAQLVRIARKARLGYEDFLYVAQQTRRKLGLRRELKQRRLPPAVTDRIRAETVLPGHTGLRRRAA
jgi:hypothetical protein